jgi:maltose O-acetyltransferase
VFSGNVEIGEHSYFNSGKIYSGINSSVKIGKWCAIGYNVNIHAITHDPDYATGYENERPLIEGSVTIGDNTWIGSNVFILPNVKIGSNCVIGANSVVNVNIPSDSIYAGVPAKLIRMKKNVPFKE